MSFETFLLPKFFPDGTIILAKEQFHNSYTFCAMPILIFSPVQIIMTHPLYPVIGLLNFMGNFQKFKEISLKLYIKVLFHLFPGNFPRNCISRYVPPQKGYFDYFSGQFFRCTLIFLGYHYVLIFSRVLTYFFFLICKYNTKLFSNCHQRYTYRVLQTIQMNLMLLWVWAELAVFGRAKTALKFKYDV